MYPSFEKNLALRPRPQFENPIFEGIVATKCAQKKQLAEDFTGFQNGYVAHVTMVNQRRDFSRYRGKRESRTEEPFKGVAGESVQLTQPEGSSRAIVQISLSGVFHC